LLLRLLLFRHCQDTLDAAELLISKGLTWVDNDLGQQTRKSYPNQINNLGETVAFILEAYKINEKKLTGKRCANCLDLSFKALKQRIKRVYSKLKAHYQPTLITAVTDDAVSPEIEVGACSSKLSSSPAGQLQSLPLTEAKDDTVLNPPSGPGATSNGTVYDDFFGKQSSSTLERSLENLEYDHDSDRISQKLQFEFFENFRNSIYTGNFTASLAEIFIYEFSHGFN
jgi:hypothetical protein